MPGIIQVIKYEGDNLTFVWKHPAEDFRTRTQLIVHESQEAVFFMNGQALDSFGPGVYTLETQNIPLISRFFNMVTGGDSPFHCEVYFINKTEQAGIKWGTGTKIEYVEPTYNFPLQIGACGEMNLCVEDGRKLLIKLVGTERSFTQRSIIEKLRGFMLIRLKPYLVTYLREKKISIFQIDEHLAVISENLEQMLRPDFQEYGMRLGHFFITTVMKPEYDNDYIHFKHLHFQKFADVAEARLRQEVGVIDQETAARRMIIEAQGIAQKRIVEGYTYQQERELDIAEKAASNEGVGQFSNLGIGMGVVAGLGNTVGNRLGNIIAQNVNGQPPAAAGAESTSSAAVPSSGSAESNLPKCKGCGHVLPSGAKFCPECGALCERYCPSCGAKLPTSGKFCMECGSKLE